MCQLIIFRIAENKIPLIYKEVWSNLTLNFITGLFPKGIWYIYTNSLYQYILLNNHKIVL